MNRQKVFSTIAMLFLTVAILGQQATRTAAAPEPQIQLSETPAGRGLAQQGGLIRVNPAAIRSYVTGSASLTHGAIAPGGCSSRTVAVAGAAIGDRVAVGPPAELLTLPLALTYAVTSQDVVSIRLCNFTAAAVTPPAWTWNVDVIKSF